MQAFVALPPPSDIFDSTVAKAVVPVMNVQSGGVPFGRPFLMLFPTCPVEYPLWAPSLPRLIPTYLSSLSPPSPLSSLSSLFLFLSILITNWFNKIWSIFNVSCAAHSKIRRPANVFYHWDHPHNETADKLHLPRRHQKYPEIKKEAEKK